MPVRIQWVVATLYSFEKDGVLRDEMPDADVLYGIEEI